MAHRKPHLPEKACATCGRPFAWRRRWARVWEEVRHCSDACRRRRRAAGPEGAAVAPAAASGKRRGGA